MAVAPALAAECRLGPPPHTKGPLVFLDYDQVELDAAYDQSSYEPISRRSAARGHSNSDAVRARLGAPQRVVYGPTAIERLDIYRAKQRMRRSSSSSMAARGVPARRATAQRRPSLFVDHGVHYVTLDFVNVLDAGGDLRPMATQVRRAIAWVARHAASFGGDARIGFISAAIHRAAILRCCAGDGLAEGVRPAAGYGQRRPLHSRHVRHEARAALGARHLREIRRRDGSGDEHDPPSRHGCTRRSVAYGSFETPEFQRQGRDFAAAATRAGKP